MAIFIWVVCFPLIVFCQIMTMRHNSQLRRYIRQLEQENRDLRLGRLVP